MLLLPVQDQTAAVRYRGQKQPIDPATNQPAVGPGGAAVIADVVFLDPSTTVAISGGTVTLTPGESVALAAGAATIGSVTTPATVGADHSVAPATLLTVLGTIAPNANRIGFYWQNQSGATIQVVLDHDTSGTNYTVILAGPGAGAGSQGADNSFAQMGIRHTGQIRICGAAGSQIAVGEY